MLEKLTKETFAPHLGSQFRFQIDASTWVTTELVEVTGRGSHAAQATLAVPSEPQREPFSIVFRGPHTPPLQQKMYRVEHKTIGVIDDLFIVPVGITQAGLFYEAVFN
jgi:hypothetical protein